ncbi:uncharacterized protein LOC103516185 [Diaphorina citri]|uniref:Uncharacterized protein LOC103516185 n=1 Tax=Diaphorina citri TaxID=121845 RepID=A0A1S3DCZ1_DIACI|nr:uncharacterized protein LOC103516185 [Diaphorina citri]
MTPLRHLFQTAFILASLRGTVGRSMSSADIDIINPQVGNSVHDLVSPATITTEPCVTTPLESALASVRPQDGVEHYGHLNSNHNREAVRRYRVADIEFHRVETPFIIAVWILSASLAKIGEFLFILKIKCAKK